MRYLLLFVILSANFGLCFSQSENDSLKTNYLNNFEIIIPNNLSTHPLGVYISRINHNFQIKPAKKPSISLNISNGNVWLPYVKAYKPIRETDRNITRSFVWHEREGNFDYINSPTKSIELHADGVYRIYHLRIDLPIFNNRELKLNIRAFSVDDGNFPFSTLTSDRFIEWFHTNIKGGEDPFARKIYGYNQTKIKYTDENGKSLELNGGNFIIPGFDLAYQSYPDFNDLRNRNIFTSFGVQLGVNISKINPSLDLGITSSINKKIAFKKREIIIGIAIGALRQRVLKFGKGVIISNKNFLYSSELMFNYRKQINRKSYFSIATRYSFQSSFNSMKDFDYIVLTGDRITTHWHHSLSHLYRPMTSNSLTFTYNRGNYALSYYLREDFYVDNAPDAQTGIEFKFTFK